MQRIPLTFCLFQVFDTTRKITYKNLPNWLKELREYRPEIPCLCAANKIDGNIICLLNILNLLIFQPVCFFFAIERRAVKGFS
jgi:hypothetical protein